MNQFWHRARDVAEVPAFGEDRFAVLNLEHGSPLVLLGSAVAIWELIDGTRTEAGILKELASAYVGSDGLAMAEQVRSFLAELSFHGLAETSDSPSARQPEGPANLGRFNASTDRAR